MKKDVPIKLLILLAFSIMFAVISVGCDKSNGGTNKNSPQASTPSSTNSPVFGTDADTIEGDNVDTSSDNSTNTSAEDNVVATELYVTFGDNGFPFTMHLYDNDTAEAIARHVGSADWRIPIYNYDDYDNWEVMQYYDIPSRYEIPSNSERVTIENSGVAYYSEPNRIVLFFGDAEVPGEYTPVGYFDSTDEFVSAVKDNPVLEGWGNKIIQISADK